MKKTLLYIFFILSFLPACKKHVPFPKIDIDKKPAVYAYLSQKDIGVSLFWSNSIYEGEKVSKIDNADISLYKEGKLIDKILMVESGKYKLNGLEIEEDSEYELKINIPNYGELKAKTITPSKDGIKEAHIEQDDSNVNLYLEFENKQNAHNYYYRSPIRAKVYFKDEVIDDFVELIYYNNDGLGYIKVDDLNSYVFSHKQGIKLKHIISRDNFKKETESSDIIDCDSAILITKIKRINSDYYKYIMDVDANKILPETGLEMENVRTYSNIENGYGIFAAYYQMKPDTLVLKLEPKPEYPSYDSDEE